MPVNSLTMECGCHRRAAGLEERDGRWWPRFDRDVMIRSLAENAQRSFRTVTAPVVAVIVPMAHSGGGQDLFAGQ